MALDPGELKKFKSIGQGMPGVDEIEAAHEVVDLIRGLRMFFQT